MRPGRVVSATTMFKNQLTMLMTMAPKTVLQNPTTLKPGIIPAILSKRALIRKVKRPKDMMLSGNVKISRIGLKNMFRKPMAAAANNAAKKPVTFMFSIR